MGTRAVYGAASTEQALGALPVVATFCRRLSIARIVDRAAPIREIALATHGQVIEALIANRLTSPTPLVHVQDWAQRFAVERCSACVLTFSTTTASPARWTPWRRCWRR
jgi:hypothetical protein